MTNYKMYLKKSDDFWALWLIIYDFKKVGQCSLFWLITCDFFSKYNRTYVLNRSKTANEHAAHFKASITLSI